MPWIEESSMDKKMQFVAMDLDGEHFFTDLCELFGVSRKTGYKLRNRYREFGVEGLLEMSRTPHNSPNRTPPEVEQALLDLKRKHPQWGARKITGNIKKRNPEIVLPSDNTVGHIFERAGLTVKKRKRIRRPHPGKPTETASEPNDIWTTDFKGEFRTLDGIYCYPLTIMDEYSRFLICCQGLYSTGYAGAFKTFRRIFREYGLPRAIKSDNGVPFATTAIARISKLSVWFIKLGIRPILIEPASPYQNGVHERMHRTLKAECTRPPRANLASQQRRFNEWAHEYNFDRTHESLGDDFPSEHYRPSLREYPSRIPRVEYPSHFEVRRVSNNHCFRWHNKAVHISSALVNEYIGLEEVVDGVWSVYFSWLRVGFLDERRMLILDDLGRLNRKKV